MNMLVEQPLQSFLLMREQEVVEEFGDTKFRITNRQLHHAPFDLLFNLICLILDWEHVHEITLIDVSTLYYFLKFFTNSS